MTRSSGDVVLVTGSSGFLGQHLLKHLQKDDTVSEIRGLDKIPHKNTIDYPEVRRMKMFICDLINIESCREAVKGANVVFHCAALVSYEFPPDKDKLYKNNVTATENLIKLCIEEGVKNLVHCSSTEVTLQSYVNGGIVALVIYDQESRFKAPKNEDKLMFGEYAASKLKAENSILKANGTLLKNGRGILQTVSLRPPMLYGEGDTKFIFKILKYAKERGGSLLKPAGAGGKQQLAYVGNVAWAFICAKNTFRDKPENIAGLVITITDDTLIEDLLRFCERVTRNSSHHVSLSWSIPTIFSFVTAFLIELAVTYFGSSQKFPVQPRSAIAYLGSVILYNRSRSSIYMNYLPIYSAQETLEVASTYYCDLLTKHDQFTVLLS